MAPLAPAPALDRDLGFSMTHAGIPALWSLSEAQRYAREIEAALRDDAMRIDYLRAMYGNEPAVWRDDLSGPDRLRVITNYLTRMRVVGVGGTLNLTFNADESGIPHGYHAWFEDYRRQPPSLAMVFGHWAALGGRCDVPGIFAVDTACVWGGALTALRLIDQERLFVGAVPSSDSGV